MIHVMLVEDEAPLLRELHHTFPWEDYGCRINAAASSIQEARHAVARETPDLVVTDVKLPDGNGIDLVVEVAPRAAIIITGFHEISLVQRAMRAGAMDFLLKPLDDGELHSAVARAVLRVLEQKPEDAMPPEHSSSHPLVRAALAFIRDTYDQRVSLQEAAHHLRISESHLAQVFKHHTGTTFVQALTAHRMMVARELLRDHRHHVAEVAQRCGYPDAGYFSRVFRRYWGSSPRSFRRHS